jgi:hypothetical protein
MMTIANIVLTSAPLEYALSTILSTFRKLGAFLIWGGRMRVRRIAF